MFGVMIFYLKYNCSIYVYLYREKIISSMVKTIATQVMHDSYVHTLDVYLS